MGSSSFKVRCVAGVSTLALAGSGLFLAGAFAGPKESKPEHWGVIERNTIGSPVAELRDGPAVISPTSGLVSAPPFGKGSVGIEVADQAVNPAKSGGIPQEKVAFGNEVDFFGNPVSDINQLGFYVLRTDGDVSTGGLHNLPNITFEIDPDINNNAPTPAPINYTSMVWVPDGTNVPVNEWSSYIDATTNGAWYFTGAAGTATGCNQTTMCSFAGAKNALGANASIISVAVAKGRDNQFQGAVDGLRINDKTYDFEAQPEGVKAKGAGK